MKNKRKSIGTYGYIDELKHKSRSDMIVYIVFAVVLFVGPLILTRTFVNAFSVAAIVMLIPAFQGFKQYISVKAFHSCPLEAYQKISQIVQGKLYIVLLSDLIFSGTTGDFVLNMAIIYNNNIYGYVPEGTKNIDEIEELLAAILAEEHISSKKPVVHSDFAAFEEMAEMLAANEPSAAQDVGRIYHQIEAYCL